LEKSSKLVGLCICPTVVCFGVEMMQQASSCQMPVAVSLIGCCIQMYVQVKKIKKTMYNVGYQKANHSKLKSAWMVWNVRYKQTVTEKNNSQIAALHWATTTIKHVSLIG